MTARRPRTPPPFMVAACLVGTALIGCGVAPDRASTGGAGSARRDEASALVVTEDGLAAVGVESGERRWLAPGAVAAPDGSAVFAARGPNVVRIDPSNGAETPVGTHGSSLDLRVAAVEPGGGYVALASSGGDSTEIVAFDPATGVGRSTTFDGTLEPEAFSLDRSLLLAARIYDDRYHVHMLDLATGEQWPTLGPDKSLPPEDMYGSVVQAVLSADGHELATLYRDDSTADHSAFVHLLSLENGATVCIDLHPPFGTATPGSDAIEWRSDGTVAVGHRAAEPTDSRTATFDPAAIWNGEPQPHYHAEAVADSTPPTIATSVQQVAGFQRFIALVPTSASHPATAALARRVGAALVWVPSIGAWSQHNRPASSDLPTDASSRAQAR